MTILGMHTIGETKAQLRYYEWRIEALNAAWRDMLAHGFAVETSPDPTFGADWDAFLNRWILARRLVVARQLQMRISTPFVSDDVLPDEANWNALNHAASPTYPGYTDKDLSGLQQRLFAMNPTQKIDLSNPPAGWDVPDLDMLAYQKVDKAAKAIEDAPKNFVVENPGKTAIIVTGLIAFVALTIRR